MRGESRSHAHVRATTRAVTRRALIFSAAAWSVLASTGGARAQVLAKIRRIGLLAPYSAADAALWHQAFRLGLRDLGWIEGKNITIEYRFADGNSERIPELAADLVRSKVDVIVASTTADTLAAKKATREIPIVMVSVADPVAVGLVESLARPGGNITGLSNITEGMVGKRLELLKEMIPRLSRIAVLWNPQGTASIHGWNEIQLPARQLGMQLQSLEVRRPDEIDKVLDDAIKARAGALFVMPDPVIATNLKRIAAIATKSRLPSIYHYSEYADAGVLVTYGPDRSDMFRRAATFVDKTLKGARPADLPVEQPTKFELVINMKTAKALKLDISRDLTQRADRLIQ